MKQLLTSTGIAARIWIGTSVAFGAAWLLVMPLIDNDESLWAWFLPLSVVAAIVSLPVLLILAITIPLINIKRISTRRKFSGLLLTCFVCTLFYGAAGGFIFKGPYINGWNDWLITTSVITACLFGCALASILIIKNSIFSFFHFSRHNYLLHQTDNMETTTQVPSQTEQPGPSGQSNTMIKGVITGALILVMMIPTLFITNLVSEREQRQKEVASEVSAKWASAQTLTGPYLYIPYMQEYKDAKGQPQKTERHLWILPDDITVAGDIAHEIRPRSIYKVLLYRVGLKNRGNFVLQMPKDIDPALVQWQDARICFGLSDFKGIEQRLAITLDGNEYELSPGLPEKDISESGLSAPISLNADQIGKTMSFNMTMKIKGSGELHFLPMAGNSSFSLRSDWSSPSFDGNNLPNERAVTDSGFNAVWTFNKANLPFGTVLRDTKIEQQSLAFGVTLLEPAGQYSKTDRCIKYAILIIGLTFSVFFIIELLQKKPFHPVQYVLVGLALVIFYILLLSVSEFILFEYAYLIAAMATISLITWYTRSHFQNWKPAMASGSTLTGLYGFIFVLISLEDTALLVGSVGLFIMLAAAMYVSRKVNWYGSTAMSYEQ